MYGLQLVDWLMVLAYFLVVIAIGVVSMRLVRNREDYLMGGRRFGKVLTALFAFGAGTHAENAMGVASQSYKVGFAGIWYQWVMIFTLPIYWLLAPIYRRSRVLTTADFYERRFGKEMMYFYTLFSLFIVIGWTSVILLGAARLIESLTAGAMPWQYLLPILAVVSFAYATAGGLIAAVWNDFLQGILTIVMSVLLIPFFFAKVGGVVGMQSSLVDPQQTFKLVLSSEMTIYWIIMMSINSIASNVAQPSSLTTAGAAKTELDTRVGWVGGMMLKRIMTVPWALTGVMAIALFGSGAIEGDHAFGAVCKALLPTGFIGLMFACVVASMMDNLAINMLNFAGIYTNGIHKPILQRVKGDVSEKHLVRVNRIVSVLFGVAAIAFSFYLGKADVPSAMRLMWNTVPLVGIPFIMGVLWRRFNRYGAFASVVAALAASLIGIHILKWTGDAGLPKNITFFLASGVVTGIVVSLLTRPEPKARTDAFFLLLKTPVGQEKALRDAGMVEIAGQGTFEFPEDIGKMDVAKAEVALTDEDKAHRLLARRQGVLGFVVVGVLMLLILLGGKLLAWWFGGG